MASLPAIKRFAQDDYQSQSNWISPLLYNLNLLLNSIYAALNNGLTLQSNCLAQINTLQVSGSSPSTSFLWKFQSNPVAIWVGNVTGTDGSAVLLSNACTCSWSYSAGVISITNVTGLTGGVNYNVTFVVSGG